MLLRFLLRLALRGTDSLCKSDQPLLCLWCPGRVPVDQMAAWLAEQPSSRRRTHWTIITLEVMNIKRRRLFHAGRPSHSTLLRGLQGSQIKPCERMWGPQPAGGALPAAAGETFEGADGGGALTLGPDERQITKGDDECWSFFQLYFLFKKNSVSSFLTDEKKNSF